MWHVPVSRDHHLGDTWPGPGSLVASLLLITCLRHVAFRIRVSRARPDASTISYYTASVHRPVPVLLLPYPGRAEVALHLVERVLAIDEQGSDACGV